MPITVEHGNWQFHARLSKRGRFMAFVAAVDLTSDDPPYPTVSRMFEVGFWKLMVSVAVPRSYISRMWLFPRVKE